MSFLRYPNYKDSGVEWGGEIPETWTPTRLRFLLRDGYNGLKIGPFGSQLTADMLEDEGVYKVYGQENIIANDFIRGNRYIGDEKFNELSVYEIKPGDLLITMMGTSGRCDVAPSNMAYGIMDSHLLRMRVTAAVRADFVRLLIDEAAYVGTQIQLAGKGSIMHGLNSSIVKNLLFFVPPIEEQTQITTFLDRETAKIDELVAEQRRLMELLKEKRSAVISHAVTKGLNPRAPMKPSGVEWLGDVPEHWEVVPLKHVITQIESGVSVNASDQPASETELGVLKTSCVYTGQFDANENKAVIETEIDRVACPLKAGTLIVSRMNAPELVGAAGLVKVAPQNIFLPDRLWQVSFFSAIPAFVHYWTQSVYYRTQIRVVCAGTSSSMQNLGQDQFRSFSFPNPPIDEQTQIAAFLDTETAKFDTLTTEAQRAIALLQERRTALISAAVTGQIDVRQ